MSSLPTLRIRTVDAFVPNPLLLPGMTHVTMPYTILGGRFLLAGSVLGLITASQKLVLSVAAAGDGSQVPVGILVEDVSAYDFAGTALDVGAAVYVRGKFNETALVFGTGHSIATVRSGLWAMGIFTQAPGFSG
jgi:hypothetical protein